MGVYIKGMEMPRCCGSYPCFHAEHPIYCQAVKADRSKRIAAPYGLPRPDWCPIEDVPTPHSRLIDADALADNWYYASAALRPDDVKKVVALDDIDRAQTIVEAEDKS